MKILLTTVILLTGIPALSSCLPGTNPCNDVIFQEVDEPKKEIEPVKSDKDKDFHWTDETDPVERLWLKANWLCVLKINAILWISHLN